MKILIAAFLFSIGLTHASVQSEIVEDLRSVLNTELHELRGEVSSLKCINHFVGILCYSSLNFEGATQSSCEETYYYLGFGQKVYERLCTTCWFGEGEEIFKPSCQ